MAVNRIHHPQSAELERFLLGELSTRESARVVAHLLTGCEACRQRMEPLATVLLQPDLIPETPVQVGSEYDFPLFRAFAAARRYAAALARERHESERDREDPLLHEVPTPRALDAKARMLRDWERCEALLARSRELRFNDPEGMLAAASLAVGLAERIAPELRGSQSVADLQAQAWAAQGNARRVVGDLAEADADLAHALARSGQGTGDPRLLARLMDLTASLRIAQRRFDEASQLLDWVFGIYRDLGDNHEAGRALISKSNTAAYALDLGGAVRLLGQSLELIDAGRDAHLVLNVVHNLAHNLVDDGRFQEASRLLDRSWPLYAAYGGRIDRTKARWVEGRIALGSGDPARADQTFREVRTDLKDIGLPYDMALVSLELASLWLEQGRTREILALLDETVSVFRERGIRREAIAALLMLREAFERERVTAALLRTVASELERLESEPVSKAS